MELLTFLLIGLVTSVIGSKVLKTAGHGLPVDTIIGAFGAYAGVTVFSLLGVTVGGDVGHLAIAVVGAFALPTILKAIPSK